MPSGATRLPRNWPTTGFDLCGPGHAPDQGVIRVGKFHDHGDVIGEFLSEPR